MILQRPMLAGKFVEDKLRYPIYGQPKFDGIRCLIKEGMGVSRTMKGIPNRYIQGWIRDNAEWLSGLDGELIVGNPVARDVYTTTMSGVMSEGGQPDFTFYVFDAWDRSAPFRMRWEYIVCNIPDTLKHLSLVDTPLLTGSGQLKAYEQKCVESGFEGAILRDPHGFYKQGRATPNQGQLIKLKRFKDAEATVVGFEELLSNQNEQTTSLTGHSQRSSHKENMKAMGTLGSLKVSTMPGVYFNIGTGFDQATRQEIWDNRDKYLNARVKYKYFETGGYNVPRFPVFLGWRHIGDA